MLTSIFQSLVSSLGELMDIVMTRFLEVLNMDLSSYLDMFPLLDDTYLFMQRFSVALLCVFSGFALAKFWTTSFTGNNLPDRPAGILLRSFAGVIGIYSGGHILEFIVRMGTIPYQEALNLNAGQPHMDIGSWLVAGAAEAVDPTNLGVASDLAIVLMEFAVLILIAINLFKLVVEVCERYLMVGILVFTSPIIYSTVGPSDKLNIFKRWFSMFVGSVIQMTISVLFLKLIVSGLQSNSNTPFILQLIMILAMCKISQRVDTYLQQIGIGVATTGESMVDDFMGLIHSMGRIKSRSGSHFSGSPVGNTALVSGGRTIIGHAGEAAKKSFADGKSFRDSVKAAKGAAADYMKKHPSAASRAAAKGRQGDDMVSSMMKAKAEGKGQKDILAAGGQGIKNSAVGLARTIVNRDGVKQAAENLKKTKEEKGKAGLKDYADAINTASSGARSALSNAMGGFASAALMFLNPALTAQRDASMAINDNSDAHDSAVQEFAAGSKALTQEQKAEAENGKINPNKYEENRLNYGITENNSPFRENEGSPDLTDAGKLAGLRQSEDGSVVGPPEAVGDFLAAATDSNYISQPAPDTLVNGTGMDEASYKKYGLKKAEEAYRKDRETVSPDNQAYVKGIEEKAIKAQEKADRLTAQKAPRSKQKEAQEAANLLKVEAAARRREISEAQNRLKNPSESYASVASRAEFEARKKDDEYYKALGQKEAAEQKKQDEYFVGSTYEEAIQKQLKTSELAEKKYQEMSSSGNTPSTQIEAAKESARAERMKATSMQEEQDGARVRLSSPDYYTENGEEAADAYLVSDRKTIGSENRRRIADLEKEAAYAGAYARRLANNGAAPEKITEANTRAIQLRSEAEKAKAELIAAENRQNPHSYYNAHGEEAAVFYKNRDKQLTSEKNENKVVQLEQKASEADSKAAELESQGASESEVNAAKAEAYRANCKAAVGRQNIDEAKKRLQTPDYYETHNAEAAEVYRSEDRRLADSANENRVVGLERAASEAEVYASNLESAGASVPEIDRARSLASKAQADAAGARREILGARQRLSSVEGDPYGGTDGQNRYTHDQQLTSAANRARVSEAEAKADQAEATLRQLKETNAPDEVIMQARKEAEDLQTQANTGRAEIREAEGRLKYNDYYSSHPAEAGAFYKSADQYAVSNDNLKRIEDLRTMADDAEAKKEDLIISGAAPAEIYAAQQEAAKARKTYEREHNACEQARERLQYQKWYHDYGESVAEEARNNDQLAYAQTINAYQHSASDIISHTIENASPYEIDRAISNINHEYGNTVHTRHMAGRIFKEALPGAVGNNPVVFFRAYNMPNRENSSGEIIYGGRVYEVGFSSDTGRKDIMFYDQRFFDSLPKSERDSFRKYTYTDGRVFYFRGTKDISVPRTGKQIVRRIAKKLGR